MRDKIYGIIGEYLGASQEGLGPETVLVSDLGLSSYDIVSLVVRFEEEFDIFIDEHAIRGIRTIADVESTLVANGAQ